MMHSFRNIQEDDDNTASTRSISPLPFDTLHAMLDDSPTTTVSTSLDSTYHSIQLKDDPPDTGASSTSNSSQDSELAPDGPADIKFSLTSNLFFLLGATIQTVIASWDVRDATIDAAWDAAHENTPAPSEGSDDGTDDAAAITTSTNVYYVLNCLGPVLYLLNALVDAKWSLYLAPSHPMRLVNSNAGQSGWCSGGILDYAWHRFMAWLCGSSSRSNNTLPLDLLLDEDDASSTTSSSSSSSASSDASEDLDEEVKDRLWDFSVALIFGLGAAMEVSSTVLEDVGLEAVATTLNVVSMHTYLASGILHLTKDRRLVLHPGQSFARTLVAMGMLLFISGSLLDVVMSYLYDPDLVTPQSFLTPVVLSWCNLLSSVLWNTNAVFFVWADCLVFGIIDAVQQRARRLVSCCCGTKPADEPAPVSSTNNHLLPETLSLPLLQNVGVTGVEEV